jgi:taurine dioxygenase
LHYCQQAPDYGGGTLFPSLSAAYDGLSAGMQTMCAGLTAIHSPSGVFGRDGQGSGGNRKPLVHKGHESDYRLDEQMLAILRSETEHPLVCAHPDTGRHYLYVTGDYMIRFKDMTEPESMPILDHLNRHVTRPEYTCRFRWRAGSLAILDNRCTRHYAVNDDEGFSRSMLRVEIAGGDPSPRRGPDPGGHSASTRRPPLR